MTSFDLHYHCDKRDGSPQSALALAKSFFFFNFSFRDLLYLDAAGILYLPYIPVHSTQWESTLCSLVHALNLFRVGGLDALFQSHALPCLLGHRGWDVPERQ